MKTTKSIILVCLLAILSNSAGIASPLINFASKNGVYIHKTFTVGQVDVLEFDKPVSLAHYGATDENKEYIELDKLGPSQNGYKKFIIKAKKPGYGELTFVSGEELIKVKVVVQNDYKLLEDQLNKLFGSSDLNDPRIQVIPAAHIGNVSAEAQADAHIYLKGTVENPKDALLAVAFAANTVNDAGVKIFSNPGGQLRSKDLEKDSSQAQMQVNLGGGQQKSFSEYYEATNKLIDTDNLHRDLVLASENERVISFIKIKEPKRFSVRVRFIEVDSRYLDEFRGSIFGMATGTDLGGAIGSTELAVPDISSQVGASASGLAQLLQNVLSPGSVINSVSPGAGNLVSGILNINDNIGIAANVNDLLLEGVLRVVNEFSLVTHSGERIAIGKGTRYPLPQVNNTLGGTQLTVDYIPIGFKGELKITDLESESIDVQLASRLSSAEASNLVFVEGMNVPVFKEEYVNSGAMLKDGQEVILNSFFTEYETFAKSTSPWGRILPFLGKSKKKEKKKSLLFISLKVEELSSSSKQKTDFTMPHIDFDKEKNIVGNYEESIEVDHIEKNQKSDSPEIDPLEETMSLPGVEI